jgi:carbonic anhydrase/acetyltransferase-like protein (isoleucine patch superfamily)
MNPLHLMIRVGGGMASRWRNLWYRVLGVRMTGYSWLRRISVPRQWADISLEPCSLDAGVVLLCSGLKKPGKLIVRSGTYINRFTMIDAHNQVEIGPNCMIGPHCYITDGDHGMDPNQPVAEQPMTARPVVLEEGVWLGAGVIILKGVRIGKGAVVGAGAVVTRDVAPQAVVAGVPARILGGRQPKAQT